MILLFILLVPVLSLYPQNLDPEIEAQIIWEEANLAVDEKRHTDALVAYEKVMALTGEYPEVLYNAAQAAYETKDLAKTKKYLHKLFANASDEFKTKEEWREAIRLMALIRNKEIIEEEEIIEEKEIIEKEGFTYLRERTYSCNGKSYTVKEYRHEKTGMEFVAIPAGEFMMGGDGYYAHKVRLSGFLIAKTEVTQGVWQKIMNTTPWRGKNYVKEGGNFAASYVSWNDSQSFCEKTGLSLPTEAQWEYACRSGSSDKYYWGNSIDGDYAWYEDNADQKGEEYAHEVGQKKANAFGLYDMSGNVWEWCADWYDGDYYYNGPTDNPNGASSGSYRVYRGGSWSYNADYCRSALRDCFLPGYTYSFVGFRLVYNFKNR